MLILRIFLQHWQNGMDIDTIRSLKSVCRETAAVCRTVENKYYLDNFNHHMNVFAPTLWQVARDYFEGDEHLHFKYQEEIPFSDVTIYTGLGREDLDFLTEFEYFGDIRHKCTDRDECAVIISRDIPGLSKKIYIYFNRSGNSRRRGAMFREEPTNATVVILAEDGKEYNHALELITGFRKNIHRIDIRQIYDDMPAHKPYRALKNAIRCINCKPGLQKSEVYVDELFAYAGNDEDWSPTTSEDEADE